MGLVVAVSYRRVCIYSILLASISRSFRADGKWFNFN